MKNGYRQTEVGIIPEDWEAKELAYLGDFKNGINKNKEDFGFGFPFVNLLNVFGKNRISYTENLGLVNSNEIERSIYNLKEGDVIFVRSSVKPEGVGLTTVVIKNLPDTVYSGFLIRFRSNIDLTDSFKQYCFHNESFRTRLISKSTVSANTNINQDSLKRLIIVYPRSKAEQTAIAEALSDADALISRLEQLIAKKRNIKQGAMQELLTGKKRLPGFSGEWEVKKLGEILQNTNLGGNYPNTEEETSYPLIKMGNIGRGNIALDKIEYIPESNIPSEKDRLQYGDVLFNTRNTLDLVGKVAIWRNELPSAYYNSNLMKLEFSPAYISSNFFMNYIFNTRALLTQLKGIATGTTSVAAIYTRDLQKVLISIPSKTEQTAIAQFLSDMDAEIEQLEQKLDKYRMIKQGMMQELLTGKTRLI